jgi:ABC-2 type transport system permease protein
MLTKVISSELTVKLRRSNALWLTMLAASLGPCGIALFMWILFQPERAKQLGLVGTKADLSGLVATWPSFASTLTVVVGMGGMLLLPFIVAYLFGREYADGTAKNMLGLPVPRYRFVVAKLVVAAIWWLLVVVLILVEAFALAAILGLPGFSSAVACKMVTDALVAAAISYLLVPVVAWITIAGRNYMLPLGFAFAMLAMGNVLSRTGWAEWFPWSIVPSLIGSVGAPVGALPFGSYIVAVLTFVIGVAGAIAQFTYEDNTQ